MNTIPVFSRRLLASGALTAAAAVTALAGCATTAAPAPTQPPASAQPTAGSSAPVSPPTSSTPPAPESNPPGDIPDNQVYVPFSPKGGGFQVTVPEGWAQTTGTGGTVRFTDKLNSVEVTRRAGRPQPTADAVQAAVVTAEGARPGFVKGKAGRVERTAGTAVKVSYRVDDAADPVTGKTVNDDVELYVFWRNGVEVDLRLAGPRGADNVDPWQTITDSFRWTP